MAWLNTCASSSPAYLRRVKGFEDNDGLSRQAKDLGFSVLLFSILSVVAFSILFLRRKVYLLCLLLSSLELSDTKVYEP